jgi:hypothetical protein
MLHAAILIELMAGVFHSSSGHKTWIAWVIAVVVLVAGILARMYRRR